MKIHISSDYMFVCFFSNNSLDINIIYMKFIRNSYICMAMFTKNKKKRSFY